MSRFVYVFKTSPGWEYCGGMAVAVADSFDEAVAQLKALDKDYEADFKFYQTIEEVPNLRGMAYDIKRGWYEVPVKDAKAEHIEATEAGWDEWLLVGMIPTYDSVPRGAWLDYNYA